MKKNGILRIVVTCAIILAMSVSTVGAASYAVQKFTAYANAKAKFTLDGKELKLTDNNGKAVTPVTINGVNYIPVSSLASVLGKTYSYDAKLNLETIGTKKIPKWVEDSFPNKYGKSISKIMDPKYTKYSYEGIDLQGSPGLMTVVKADTKIAYGEHYGQSTAIKIKDSLQAYVIIELTYRYPEDSYYNDKYYTEILDKDNNIIASYSLKDYSQVQLINISDVGDNEIKFKIYGYSGGDTCRIMILDPKTTIDVNN